MIFIFLLLSFIKSNDLENLILSSAYIEIENNKIIKNKIFNSNFDDIFQIGSVSKFINCILVGILYEKRILDYDIDINNYLKSWKLPINGITLRTLLSHTSGLDPTLFNKISSLGYGSYLMNTPKNNLHSNSLIIKKFINSNSFIYPPFTKFDYSNIGVGIIQLVLEELTQNSISNLMQKFIFNPLNLYHSTAKILYPNEHNFKLSNSNGIYNIVTMTSSGGVWMSPNDLIKLSLDLLNSFNFNNGILLNQNTIKMICEKQLSSQYGLGPHIFNDHFGHNGVTRDYITQLNFYPNNNKIILSILNYDRNLNKKFNLQPEQLQQLSLKILNK